MNTRGPQKLHVLQPVYAWKAKQHCVGMQLHAIAIMLELACTIHIWHEMWMDDVKRSHACIRAGSQVHQSYSMLGPYGSCMFGTVVRLT